ncbi:MAG: BolA family transcriptional regulator [Alphaproteobacteria bacterium]|nr:BolA family transcriptional regulator [Alphaproteobacteria bacterium]
MAMSQDQIKSFLIEAFPDAKIEIRDLAGDNDHYEATVITSAFCGKTRIQQHQMVYAALKGYMGTKLHALSLKTHNPME